MGHQARLDLTPSPRSRNASGRKESPAPPPPRRPPPPRPSPSPPPQHHPPQSSVQPPPSECAPDEGPMPGLRSLSLSHGKPLSDWRARKKNTSKRSLVRTLPRASHFRRRSSCSCRRVPRADARNRSMASSAGEGGGARVHGNEGGGGDSRTPLEPQSEGVGWGGGIGAVFCRSACRMVAVGWWWGSPVPHADLWAALALGRLPSHKEGEGVGRAGGSGLWWERKPTMKRCSAIRTKNTHYTELTER